MGLSAFEPRWNIALYMDFSSIGMGLVLTQRSRADKDKQKIIYCDSTRLSPALKRYLALYGEHMALCWAILHCKFWLKGAPHFTVYSDQIALLLYTHKREIYKISQKNYSIWQSS